MVYFTIGQKLAIGLVSTAFIVNLPYLIEKLHRKSNEKTGKNKTTQKSSMEKQDKLAEASRLTEEARILLIKSKQIQEDFLLNDTTFTTPSVIGSKTTNDTFNRKIDALNYENVSFGEQSKRNMKDRVERSENFVNTLFIVGENGEFVESIRFTDKDYTDALNATQIKNKSNFMKNCFK